MRLEQLFKQIERFMSENTVSDNRATVSTLLDILTIFSRNDIKQELLKELDRHSNVLSQISQTQGVDTVQLKSLLIDLETISNDLYASSGKIGLDLMQSELFKSISQRSSIPGGTCAFDLPEYHYWLQQSEKQRQYDLEQWFKPFETIQNAISIILQFIRESTDASMETADSGFFQQSLDHTQPFQLLRVGIDRSSPYFAEISGGKHRFTVRFMEADTTNRPSQTDKDIQFSLTRCMF